MNGFFKRWPHLAAAGLGIALAGWPGATFADDYSGQCATVGPDCVAPRYCVVPQTCPQTTGQQQAMQQAVQQAAPGMYHQPPATGEFEGESSGYGVRGFGLSLPAIHLEGATLRMPRLFRSKAPARMRTDSQIAPYVAGPALQFGYIPTVPAGAAVQQAAPATQQGTQQNIPEVCVPPAPPCSARERRLQDELARKEADMQALRSRFDQLEDKLNRMASSPTNAAPGTGTVVEARFSEEQPANTASDKRSPRNLGPLRTRGQAAAQKSSGSKAARSPSDEETHPRHSDQSAPPSRRSEVNDFDEDGLGVWVSKAKSSANRPASLEKRLMR